jgi:hypothetical protein
MVKSNGRRWRFARRLYRAGGMGVCVPSRQRSHKVSQALAKVLRRPDTKSLLTPGTIVLWCRWIRRNLEPYSSD